MMRAKILLAAGAAIGLSGCFGGAEVPDYLLTLAPAQTRPADTSLAATPGQTVTVADPVVPQALQTQRVPVHSSPMAISYLKDAQWVEAPNVLFRRVVAETIAATTGRVVLDPDQYSHDPGVRLTGQLRMFGLDATTMQAVAIYDAVMERPGGAGIVTRRFEARVPVAAATPEAVAPALNEAANRIGSEVAAWIGA